MIYPHGVSLIVADDIYIIPSLVVAFLSLKKSILADVTLPIRLKQTRGKDVSQNENLIYVSRFTAPKLSLFLVSRLLQ